MGTATFAFSGYGNNLLPKEKFATPGTMKTKRTLRVTPAHLICPKCLEILLREDIEGFGSCPYCNYRFKPSDELEDFLLTPLVEQWMQQARRQFAGDPEA